MGLLWCVKLCIHGAIVAATVNATVGAIGAIVTPTGRGDCRRNDRSMYTLHYCMHIQLHDRTSFVV